MLPTCSKIEVSRLPGWGATVHVALVSNTLPLAARRSIFLSVPRDARTELPLRHLVAANATN